MFLFSTKLSKKKKRRMRNSPNLPAISMRRQTRARKRMQMLKKRRRLRRKNPATRHSALSKYVVNRERRSRQFRQEGRFKFWLAQSRRNWEKTYFAPFNAYSRQCSRYAESWLATS